MERGRFSGPVLRFDRWSREKVSETLEGSAAHTNLFLTGYLLKAKGTTNTSRKALFAGPQLGVTETGA